jgi:sRNA-binding protein
MTRPILHLKKVHPTTPPVKLRTGWDFIRRFPAIIHAKPLEIGSFHTLADRRPEGMSKRTLRRVLRGHCQRERYLKAVAADGSQRHNLHGKPVGMVSEDERAFARDRLGGKHV